MVGGGGGGAGVKGGHRPSNLAAKDELVVEGSLADAGVVACEILVGVRTQRDGREALHTRDGHASRS